MNDRASSRLILAAACGAMAWFSRHALDTRSILVSWDLQGHLLRAQHLVDSVACRQGFTAWFPYWHGGFPLSEVYPPLATWLLGAFVALGIGTFAARLALMVCWIAVVPCSYFFLRSCDLERVPAAAGACLAATINANWTFGSYAIFSLGLLPNALGFLLAVLFLGSARRLTLNWGSWRNVARTAVLGGLTILAHPFSAVWAATGWVALALTQRLTHENRGSSARPLVLAGLWAVAIGSFYWLPFLANRSNLLTTEPFLARSFEEGWRTMALLEGMGGPIAAALATLGLMCLARPARRSQGIFFIALIAIGFVLSTGVLAPVFPFAGIFGRTQWARFEGFYGWTVLMTAAFSIEGARAVAGRVPLRRTILSATAIGLTLIIAFMGLFRQRRYITLVTPAPIESLRGMVGELQRQLRPGEWLLTENSVEMAGILGSPHFLNQRLSRANPNFWDQGGSLPEGTAAAEELFSLSRGLAGQMPDARKDLGVAGVRFLATVHRESREALDPLPWLKRLWSDERVKGMALYEVVGYNRRFGLAPDLSARLNEVNFSEKEGYGLHFVGEQKLTYPMSTALAFHPWLEATADGEPLDTDEGELKRLVFTAGPDAATDIQIAYVPPRWFMPIRALALIALALALAIARPRRRVRIRS